VLASLVLVTTEAAAIPCPGDGAKVRVIINNSTTSTGHQVTISGHQIPGQATCVGASDSYSTTVTLSLTGNNEFVVPASRGLASGMWVHRISGATGQAQHQKGMVVFTSTSGDYTKVNWTFYPTVATVNRAGDTAVGTCLPDCTFRQAINLANLFVSLGLGPTLVQFSLSPGIMTQTSDITIADSITIDGTNFDGNPKIVGDALAAAQGSQDPFPRQLDLANKTRLIIGGDDVTIKGLAILNTGGSPLNDALVESTGANTRIEAVQLDGGTGGSCDTAAQNFDLIRISGASPSEIVNVEGRAARSNGLRLSPADAPNEVRDSWLHHNCASGVQANGVILTRNVIELSGRRLSNNQLLLDEAVGILGDAGSEIGTNANLIRNNASFGIDVQHVLPLTLENDAVCGNGSTGIAITGTSSSQTVRGTGLGSVYNADEVDVFPPFGNTGLTFAGSFQTGTLDFDDNSAFTANLGCGLNNTSSTQVFADNNQWRDATSSCTSSPDYCGGPIDCDVVQSPVAVNLVLDPDEPTYPTNALLKGQTLRVQGVGFNAIAGNPLHDPDGAGSLPAICSIGTSDLSSSNCCRLKSKANVCEGGSPPAPHSNGSTCVALRNAVGQWQALPVTSVTPTTIVAEISGAGYGCVGGAGEMLRVVKQGSGGPIAREVSYCLTTFPQ
jgi:hypothetical protein